MSITSLPFLLFFAATLGLYYIIPLRFRRFALCKLNICLASVLPSSELLQSGMKHLQVF